MPTAKGPSKRTAPCPSVLPWSSNDSGSNCNRRSDKRRAVGQPLPFPIGERDLPHRVASPCGSWKRPRGRALERGFSHYGPRASSCIICTALWAGWASRAFNSDTMREACDAKGSHRREAFRPQSRSCSASWRSCSSTPPAFTSRVKAGRAWDSTDTARTTGPT